MNKDLDFFSFEDAPNTATITCCHIIENNEVIKFTSHDESDGMWQFLCDKSHDENDTSLVSLFYIFDKDKFVGKLAKMPYGYYAKRKEINSEWVIRKH